LSASRRQAQDLIAAGRVTVAGGPALKASRLVGPDEAVLVLDPGPRFVGRGGVKLDAALDRFAVPVAGARVLDAGASTGGFTDCLLQRGARSVAAVDVGYGQLHERLRADDRVEVHDRTNLRDLAAGDLGAPVDLVVADLSFISLRLVLPNLLALARPGAHLVLLVKPQFEAGRLAAARGRGVIRDPAVWRQVLDDVSAALAANGAAIMDAMVSPLPGADGNVEFLLHAVAPSGVSRAPGSAPASVPGGPLDLDDLVAEATAVAELPAPAVGEGTV
jgi:23S rRNA (cytidine1920-2'-O)/16S rRNA (cytidine1409-2'-O)-methyltransferase